MIEELIGKIFCTRNKTHVAHWKTKSYAQHKALGGFYESVIDLIDDLVEAYQGNFGIIGKVTYKEEYDDSKVDCVKCLTEDVTWIAEHRSHIAQDVDALENIVDEITALYLKTLYKLENLS